MTAEINRSLGRIEGKLDMVIRQQEDQGEKLDAHNARLGAIERKSAVNGALGGGVCAVGIALLVEGFKRGIGSGG